MTIGQPEPGATLAADRAAAGESTWRFAAAGVRPKEVVRPDSIAEVVAAVRSAVVDRRALVVAGKGARLAIGNPPLRFDVALSTERLSSIEAHRPEDMTVTVQSGMTLAHLNEELAASRQCLPLDPAVAEQTTIGGLIAADACGPLRHSQGKVRDFLLGLELVDGNGELVRAGGRVVKNVAGYDVAKLLCGSFGTLGVIVSATFKVRPTPEVQRMYLWPADSLPQSVARTAELDGAGVRAAYLEALDSAACESIGVDCAAATIVGFAGSAPEVEQMETRLNAAGGGVVRRFPDEKMAGAVGALRNFPLPANEEALVARLSLRPAQLADVLARVEIEARARELALEVAAHAGVGVARCQIFDRGESRRGLLFAEWLRLAVRERGGWVIFEAIPEALRGKVDTWGFSTPSVPLMRGVKRVFDPLGLFSRGRFVAGI